MAARSRHSPLVKLNQLKPGADVRVANNRVNVSGQVSVAGINGLLARLIFDRNPDREFYIEESFALDGMYPHLPLHGPIPKLNRQVLPMLTRQILQHDHEYWSHDLQPMPGGWLNDNTPLAEATAFAERVYPHDDVHGFTRDPESVQDTWAEYPQNTHVRDPLKQVKHYKPPR